MSSNKPTAVHFTLVFSVMLCLILGVVAYLYAKEYSTQVVKAKEAQDAATASDQALSRLNAAVEELKTVLGYNYEDLGLADPPPANTVLGELNKDLQSLGRDLQQSTVKATLESLRTSLDAANDEIASLKADKQAEEARMLALRSNYQSMVDQAEGSARGSETQLQQLISQRDEMLAQKDDEITVLRNDFRREQVEKETVRDDFAKYRRETEEKMTRLSQQIDFLGRQLDEVTKVSFERPDGTIVRVNNTTNTVWISLGTADNLREQVTFSVYSKDNNGYGREQEDIKAKIEVTRVFGPHLSEAKILEDDLFRPIVEGDPIYSPLWSAGRQEYFAFVGAIDLDGDGRSDRQAMEEIVANAGAMVDLQVTDEGLRVPADAQISERTKFLVVGDIADPSDFPGRAEEAEQARRVMAEHKSLIEEARLFGVRVVSLNDFLAYIGYKPQQRLFQPGQDRPYNLRHGARSTATTERPGAERSSSGVTSELFRRGRTGQKTSSGQTSGRYGQ